MAIIFSTLAVLMCWIWIELFIFMSYIFNKRDYNYSYLSINKFKWILRFIILSLFSFTIIYMYFFQTEELKKTISLCLGIIK